MANRYDQAGNFVTAEPVVTIEPPHAELIRRADVVQTVDRMLDAYSDQQRTLLSRVQHDATSGGFLSNAAQVAERRKTTLLYLMYYALVVGMMAGGLVLLAHGAGYLDAGGSFAVWLALTGGLALLLGWKRHGDELMLTPEGIARHILDWQGDIASYEAETRRLSLQWEHEAEARRQAAQEKAAESARQQAQVRLAELDARRKVIEAQGERRSFPTRRHDAPTNAIAGAERTETSPQVQSIDDAPADDSSGVVGGWQAALVQWVASLYDAGAVTESGVIKGRAPWAARSPWVESDKAEARRVCCEMRPKLIVPTDGGRWRLRIEAFPTAEQALALLSLRLS